MAEDNKVVKNVENLDSLKEKLITVTNEIDAIKLSFSKSAEDLSRIQNMLSVGNIEDVSGVLDKYESQIADAEKQRIEATESSKKYSEELEKEKERLIKLWDAYKNQEEELSNTEKKLAEYEGRAKAAEASKGQIEDDYNARIQTLEQKLQENEDKVSQYDEFRQKCEEFDTTRNNLEQEIHTLKEENKHKETEIEKLNTELGQMKEMENYEEYKDKYEEINAEYEKEKERLTKLYQLYEETDTECKRLKEENKNWESWYNNKMDMFNKLFTNAPPVTAGVDTEVTEEKPETPDEIQKKKPKAKKKLKFRNK